MSKSKTNKIGLSLEQIEELIATLKRRFEKNMQRHKGIKWPEVEARLEAHADKLWSLYQMESTGGEPDVVAFKGEGGLKKTKEFVFIDCSPESPKSRRSLCYDHEALESRKENKPLGSALDKATEMGIDLLTEGEYRELQEFDELDTKTSSWVHTPPEIRKLGGALFCDRRYDHVFLYHNGAESYYAARGFRGLLRL
jgi:hypothetical protein